MAISGNQKALMYALGGVMRGGASRGGYVSGHVFINVGGGQRRTDVKYDSLSIVDNLDEAPNRCSFTLINTTATLGQPITITQGSVNTLEPLFAGHVATVENGIGLKADQLRAHVSCVDYTWQLGFVKVTKRYAVQSASAIAADLVATFAGVNGFTSTGVAAGLPSLDEITFTNEDLPDALTRLARRIGGYWYVDYRKVVHLFITPEVRNGDPRPLTPTHPTLSLDGFSDTLDRTQALTRVYVEGRGTTVLGPVLPGDTVIPLETVDMFTAAADVFLKVSFQGADGAAQHLNFSGVVPGGAGSLVGPGAGPPGAPSPVVAVGAGLASGTYWYGYTDVTPSGESLPSPIQGVAVGGVIPAPPTAPTVTPQPSQTGVDSGASIWAVTFQSGGGGETTPSPGTYAQTTGPLTPTGGIRFVNLFGNGPLQNNRYYDYVVTYVGLSGETTRATWNGQVFTSLINVSSHKCELFIGSDTPTTYSVPAGTTAIKVYRSKGDAGGGSTMGPYLFAGNATVYTYNDPTYGPQIKGNFMDLTTDAALGAALPTTNTAVQALKKVRVSLPIGPAGITGRRVYRVKFGFTTFLLAATIANNTDTFYDDVSTEASLGAAAPTANTAGTDYARVLVSAIAPGPAPTTSRKLYRTPVNGGALKFVATLTDNTTTTWLDALPDASLGATAPSGDTSSLQVPAGSVGAGAPSLIVANAGVFEAGGGWAIIGNGEQVIRYTGKTGTALTGIPSAGAGAITAAVAYNSTVTSAPMLTGIPATGVRGLTRGLSSGDEIYLVVQVDDTARQSQLAATMGGNGIREEWVQDRRLSIPEARARGLATLAVRTLAQDTLRYRCRDARTAAGKTVTAEFPAPLSISAAFKIQTVTINNFRPYPTQYPTYTVEASSVRFSFEDWLRALRTKE